MTVSTDLVVIYIQQTQPLDDTLRSQVVAVMNVVINILNIEIDIALDLLSKFPAGALLHGIQQIPDVK